MAASARKTAAPKAATPKKAAKKAASKKAPSARPGPGEAKAAAAQAHAKAVERRTERAEHQHQDPRGPAHHHNPAPSALGVDPRKDQGAIKTRGVPRMNKIVNWFRRGQGR